MRAEGVSGSSGVLNGVKGAMPGKVCHKLFRKMDRNHDGIVSRDEARQSGAFRFLQIAQTNDDEKKVFDKIDANHDGGLSEAESTAFFTTAFAQSKKMFALATLFVADVPDDDEETARTTAKKKPDSLKKKAVGAEREHQAAKADALSPANVAELAKYALQKSTNDAGAGIDKTRSVLDARQAAQYAESVQKSDDPLAAASAREQVA
jgi:hypothetical protein